ncbi:hypothetical protein PENANT_c011G08235 [Penicillium antarcticum]|uniref:Uncharacterized protein n=1 Tax=Penicillium antarcticum TaxID=416450 RepID=A0A1V6Q6K0_9EURO|nr:hypothetical protein PENANT_c011G08235 [Penicillium antarcticum]
MLSNYKSIDTFLSNHYTFKRGLPWGFAIYRCSYKDDSAWNRLLQHLEERIKTDLEYNKRMDLLPHHQFVINDDVNKFNGATSHDIRDHFNTWVKDQLPQVVASPDVLEHLQSSNRGLAPEYYLGARWNFCLFVDDFCLDALEHIDSINGPVVKILSKQWGNLSPEERKYQIHPDWHDGETDDELEMVGWMYIPTCECVWWYDLLEDQTAHWDGFYLRPPQLFDGCNIVDVGKDLARIRYQS